MFKLLEIEFINHPFFGSLPIKFVGEGEEKAENYTTLIIGPNGTGKSQIFLAAISIFNSLENAVKNNKKYSFSYEYILKFSNGDQNHKIEYHNNELWIDDLQFPKKVRFINLPTKVIVAAFNFNDKYPLRENRGKIINENYHYLGLKSTTNNIFIGNPPKETISKLYNAILQEKDILPLKEAFMILELKPELKLIYKPGKNFNFLQNNNYWENRKLSPSEFETAFTEYIQSKPRKSNIPQLRNLGYNKIEKILIDKKKLEKLSEYLKEYVRLVTDLKHKEILVDGKLKTVKKELSLQPILNFEDINTFFVFTKQVELFQILSDLEIISFDRFEIKKQNINFSFDDASSGEYHIIFTFINILSVIENNSIVLLDEPEISLHPNWQIKYMSIFNRIFQHFPNSHFLIASHSHFIVSDLKSKNSFILAVDVNEKGEIEIIPTPKNTYGWSTEQILLDVFKVATTRNFYISTTITDVLKEMSTEHPNFEFIKSKLKSIVFLDTEDFNKHDPLLDIFKELKNFYIEINNA